MVKEKVVVEKGGDEEEEGLRERGGRKIWRKI